MDKDIKDRLEKLENKINVLLDIIQGFDNKGCQYTLFSWLDNWYNVFKVPELKASSLSSIHYCIEKHIKSNINDIPLNKLTGLNIQQVLNSIKSSRMRKYTYDVFHASLLQAQKLEIINKDIMLAIKPTKHIRKNGRALSLDEQSKFVKQIKGNAKENLYKFYLLSGVRKTEALTLRKSDIDFKNHTIFIAGTKTEKSARYIPLTRSLELLLNSIKCEDLYFPYTPNEVYCNFKRLKSKYKWTFTIHSLRHTFATRCLECGISLKMVQKWLGHSKLDTTSNIYMHIQTEFEKTESAKLKIL